MDLSKVASENTQAAWRHSDVLLMIWASHFLLSVPRELNKMLVQTYSKLVASIAKQWPAQCFVIQNNKFWLVSFQLKIRNVKLYKVLRINISAFPEISDIPDKYDNLLLMSLLSVLHEDKIKTLLSQQIKKLTRCYFATSML